MKLKVTLRGSGTDLDIQITADATATAGDVADALAGANGDRPPAAATGMTLRIIDVNGLGGNTLNPRISLVDSGIRSGSILQIAPAAATGATRGSAAALLRVLSGPDAGVEVPLPAGLSSIGRSMNCDVTLNDALVSKRHAQVMIGDRVEVIDTNSSNGVIVGGVRVARIALGPGDVVTLGSTDVAVERLGTAQGLAPTSTDIAFVRPPRVLVRPEPVRLELPSAPQSPEQQQFPWLAMIAPLAMGGAMLAMPVPRGLSLLFVGLSPLIMLGNFFGQRHQLRKRHRAEVATFQAQLEQARADLRRAHSSDRAALERLYPSVAECVESVHQLGELLWSRRPEHPEFLQVRLGLGDIPAYTTGDPGRGRSGLPELNELTRELAREFDQLPSAPVIADLRSVGGIGLSGDRAILDGVARAVVVQVAALQSPAEVVIACLTSQAGKQRWGWLEWLPHCASPQSPLGALHLSADPGTGRVLLEHLEHLVEARSRGANAKQRPRGPLEGADEDLGYPVLPSVLVVVDEAVVDAARLTRVAERGPDVGVHVLWVSGSRAGLPGACRTFLDLADGRSTSVGMVRRGITIGPVVCEAVDSSSADLLARAMAPVVDAGAPVEDVSDLPRAVPVVTILGPEACDDPDVVLGRWRENHSLIARDGSPPKPLSRASDLRALVGHAGSEPFTLDLRTQGPHALVGGTTGAGKSEFLQAWVLGLAHAYSPDRVTFLFVDYKGGAAFAKCVELPHCVGLVTDLSTYLVRRALRSLRAELRHREHLLNAKGQKDLIDLEKTGDPECPPSLIIVVDEFAALVGEVPEFVDGVVDVAQRGRSLGLHLVLATQRPAGVIRDNLRANTNLRVALRMADEHDSSDVLGDAMAAHFDPSIPGRGAAKTGPGRIARFQSAFPGSRTPARPPVPSIDVVTLDFGAGAPWKMPERRAVGDDVEKDIVRVVNTVAEAARRGQVQTPRKPWLETLRDCYDLAALGQRDDTRLILGVVDDPDRQAQDPEFFRPDDEGNVLFVGASGSGKSTALRSLACAAALQPQAGPVFVYGIDFAGGALTQLEDLPNVGSVVSGDDEERVTRLLRLLGQVIEERGQRYNSVRASTLTDYRRLAAAPQEPRVLLLLDGFTTFRTEYETTSGRATAYQQFLSVLAGGRAVGVHVAVTADRPTGVPISVMSAFQRKIVLRQSGEEGYISLGAPKDVLSPTSAPGRAVQVGDDREMQLAVLGPDPSAAAQARALDELVAGLAGRYAARPEPIMSLPALVPAAEVPATAVGLPVLGMRDTDLEFMGFAPRGVVMLSGPAQSGRTAAVRWLAESIHRAYPNTPLAHLTARRSSLAGLPIWRNSVVGADHAKQLVEVLLDLAAGPAPDDAPLMAVFVEYLPEYAGTPIENQLTELVTRCRRNGHLLVADGEGSSWSKFSALLNEAKADRTGLLLQPDMGDGDSLLRTALPRCKRSDFPPGRGYWVSAGKAVRVQLPLVE